MKKRLIVGVTLIGTLLFAAWLLGWFSSNAAIAEVQQLREKMAEPGLSDADRQTLREQMRTKLESLSPDARRAVFEAGRQAMERRFESHIDEILAMSPTDRNKALDADIDRMQKIAADIAKRQQAAGTAGAGAKSGAEDGKGGKKGNRPAAVTDDQKVSRLRGRLDRSTPESRAKRAEYTRLINDRLKQRGLPATIPGPPRTGRWIGVTQPSDPGQTSRPTIIVAAAAPPLPRIGAPFGLNLPATPTGEQ